MSRVSVIVPTFNCATYIVKAVESVLAQTYQDFELIVVDDGSTDNTRNALIPYINHIQYVWQDNQGRSAARNLGIRLAQGELIGFLDADDMWLPHKLEYQVAAMDSSSEAVLACCPAQNIDADGRPITFWGSACMGEFVPELKVCHRQQEMLFGSSIGPSTVVVRREALERSGVFDTQLTLGEDWDLWLRLAPIGPFLHIPEALSQYRAYGMEREVRKRSSDYLVAQYSYVIEKAAKANPDEIPSSLRDHAIANVYIHSALASYQLGDLYRGHKMLASAMRLNPALGERQRFAAFLEDHARRILYDTGKESQALTFLNTTVANLPPRVESPQHGAREILSRVYMADVFRACKTDDYETVQRAMWPGVRNDLRWLLNRGVISIAVRTLLRRVAG